MSFTVEVPLRWGDMDAQAHVNNAGFIDYLQEARVDFLLASPVAYLLGGGIIVVSHQIEYRAPIAFSTSPVVAEVTVAAVKGAVLELAYTLSHDGAVAAIARTRLCPYDFEKGCVRRLTTEERARMKELERENRELRRANEILKRAASFFGAELDRQHQK